MGYVFTVDDLTQIRRLEREVRMQDRLAAVGRLSAAIAHEVRNQYVLAYSPANPAASGGFRKIRVDVNVPGVTVRTRSGYYAGSR